MGGIHEASRKAQGGPRLLRNLSMPVFGEGSAGAGCVGDSRKYTKNYEKEVIYELAG